MICGDGWKSFVFGIVKATRGMGRICRRDPINHSLRLGWPIGGGEREPVVRSRVHGIQLHCHAVNPRPTGAELSVRRKRKQVKIASITEGHSKKKKQKHPKRVP